MKRSLQVLITLSIVFTTIFAMAQQASQPPTTNKIEGSIITGLSTANSGMPSFTLKTGEGTEYTIHPGTLKNADGEVFAPKVGDAISVVGTPCCGMAAQSQGQNQSQKMIHAAEITVGQKTYRAPAASMGCMMMGQMGQGMMGQGMMGQAPTGQGQPGQGMQGMMMHPSQPGQGQPGQGMQGMMMCPGMAGQPTPGQSMPGHEMPTTPPPAPGAMACCGSSGASAGCAGCAPQHPPAATPAPAPAPEPEMEHMH